MRVPLYEMGMTSAVVLPSWLVQTRALAATEKLAYGSMLDVYQQTSTGISASELAVVLGLPSDMCAVLLASVAGKGWAKFTSVPTAGNPYCRFSPIVFQLSDIPAGPPLNQSVARKKFLEMKQQL